MSLKSETISLAVSVELPLLIVDIQRGGPSTGLPTKTEAADLNIALYGRHGEAPLPIVASYSPVHCFHAAIEAARIALKYRTPVILLSDGYLANGSEPWRLPDVDDLPDISVPFHTELNATDRDGNAVFWPYLRDPDTLARPWAIPGTPGLMHRIGGLEKADGTGNVNYTPENHGKMVALRAAKIARIADDLPELEIQGDPDAELCLLGWGSTWAAIDAAMQRRRRAGRKIAWIHLTHLSPLPNDLGEKLQPVPPRAGARAQQRSADPARAVRVPGRRQGPHQDHGPPVHRPRDRSRDRKDPGGMTDAVVNLTSKKDWASDQEVRWCPGCGDYGILLAVQQLMPELGVLPENTVFISGIGCSSRFPYYMNTYGMHSIHGRAPAIATGVAVARPDLDVWVITGDGDGLSIGGNHLIHALRRNVNLTILLFNNRIYGLTKGQYSPTSEVGKVTKSTPFGSVDPPFNPLSVALGAEASFVARTHDLDRKHMIDMFRAAHDHRGSSFVEIYQNCNVFNDHQFDDITKRSVRDEMMIDLVHGEPIRFGADGHRGVVMGSDGQLRLVEVADVGEDALLVHDAHRPEPSLAFALARLNSDDHSPTPFGIFRQFERTGVRRRGRRPARRGIRAQGSRQPRRPPAVERHLARQLTLSQPIRNGTTRRAEDPPFLGLDDATIGLGDRRVEPGVELPLRSAAASDSDRLRHLRGILDDAGRRATWRTGSATPPPTRRPSGRSAAGRRPRPVVNGQTSTRCGCARSSDASTGIPTSA